MVQRKLGQSFSFIESAGEKRLGPSPQANPPEVCRLMCALSQLLELISPVSEPLEIAELERAGGRARVSA